MPSRGLEKKVKITKQKPIRRPKLSLKKTKKKIKKAKKNEPQYSLRLSGGLTNIQLFSRDTIGLLGVEAGVRVSKLWLHLGYRSIATYTNRNSELDLEHDLSQMIMSGSYGIYRSGILTMKLFAEFMILNGDYSRPSVDRDQPFRWSQTNLMFGGGVDFAFTLSQFINLGLRSSYSAGFYKSVEQGKLSELQEIGPLQQDSRLMRYDLYYEFKF